jgi:hypothetical protein
MLALLLEHQTLDTWMTYNLMETAIRWLEKHPCHGLKWKFDGQTQTRDQQSSTSATVLKLEGKPVDSFFNFQAIRVGGGALKMRHQNRPDGMFLVELHTESSMWTDMALFYEGDVHGKDDGKSLTKGCKNSHKMYQAIVQAQSRNSVMAACVIFAAMEFAPTDKLIEFLDDMFRAHIFACIAIADWNAHIQENRRKTTLLGSLFNNALQVNMEYDFVFGINIGIEPGSQMFETSDFEHRMTEMLTPLGIAANDIRLQDEIKKVAAWSNISQCPQGKASTALPGACAKARTASAVVGASAIDFTSGFSG